ncbi:MAG TPA: hypothetical protein VES89_05040, partial [Candidatus Competibacteraceae bacterium]|nr:hypothetical protein [Candidatus Competibacteraceae bacterium]
MVAHSKIHTKDGKADAMWLINLLILLRLALPWLGGCARIATCRCPRRRAIKRCCLVEPSPAVGIPWMLWLAALALALCGCATPVGVEHVDTQTAYRIQTESALATGQPSEPSKRVLRRLGLLDRFEAEPAEVLADLHRGLSPKGDDDRLFALAELSFLQADRTGDRAYFLASAVYAWALLFPDDATGTHLQPSDPRFRLTYDLYNQAVAKGLAAHSGRNVDLGEDAGPGERVDPGEGANRDEVRL